MALEENLMKQPNCLQCGKTLSGRIDKKFCDEYCRNTYNNRNKRSDEKYIRKVNSIIRRNRRILKSLCPIGKATVRKEVMDAMGYDYKYFSGIIQPKKDQVYYICYDYAFSPIHEQKFNGEIIEKAVIVQKQDYFDKYKLKLW
ncbi:MAG: hypothetical protein R3345_12150 [Fulvivirga sp.]|nr:hypothetical protein [Fulvivirga sp.]